ncbi:MAG: histidinol-phosphate transaminase, partial [Planctomycetota bacterium]
DLRKRSGLPYTEVAPGLSLKSGEEPEGTHGLVLGVGSSEVLRAAAWAFCSKSGTIIEPYPSYAAIGGIAEGIPGSTIQRVKVPLDGNRCLDTRAMINAIDSNTRLVMICNPNNPTGTTIPVEEVEAIATAAPSDALVFIDEAYIEFAKDPKKDSALEFAKTRSNVLISRTFSKIYGLAGLRIGYGISHVDVLEQLRPHLLGRLSFNMPGILAASAALEDQEHLDKTLELNETIHETWRREFKSLGWKMTPSITCFCWLDLGHDCAPLVDFLANRGVLISGGQRWDLPNYVRISIGTEEENDRLIAGMKAFQAS